jgi:hypothetical protein
MRLGSFRVAYEAPCPAKLAEKASHPSSPQESTLPISTKPAILNPNSPYF